MMNKKINLDQRKAKKEKEIRKKAKKTYKVIN